MVKKKIVFLALLCFLVLMNLAAREMGDVDNNSIVNIVDALVVAQYSVGLDVSAFSPEYADVDCNGVINIVDSLRIAQYYVGLISGFGSCEITPAPQPTPTPTWSGGENLVLNPGFEDGTTDGWFPFGKTNSIAVSTGEAHTGSYSCLTSNRTEEWMGIGLNLLDILASGKSYRITIYVKLANASSADLKGTVKVVDSAGEETYNPIVSAAVTNTEWKEMRGIYMHEAEGSLSEVSFYLEDIDPSINFYVDDVKVEEINSDWKPEALARIEELRTRDVNLTVYDTTGARVDDADIIINQTRHEFAFGTAVSSELNRNSSYRKFFKENYEWAVFENEAKWYSNESSQGNVTYAAADQMYQYCEENNIPVRGHCIFWAVDKYVPSWLQSLDNTQLRAAMESRLDSAVNHFKGKFVHWDVNNEMLHGSFFKDRLGDDIRPWMYSETHDVDPDALLFVNDYNVVSQGETGLYVDQIRELLEQGAPVQAIGVQGHFEGDLMPLSIYDRLDQLAQFNLPIWVTEFDVTDEDVNSRADKLENFFRIAFSHPAVEGIMMWGYWEGNHWRENAHIVDQDWTINAAGERYQELMEEWTTRISGKVVSGTYAFRGYHGEYEAAVTTSEGVTTVVPFSLPSGSGPADITIEINKIATPSPSPRPTPEGGVNMGLDLLYNCGEKTPVTSQVKPRFTIANNGSQTVSLADLTIRYYYTKDGDMDQMFQVDYAQISPSRITGTFFDGYLEIGFTADAGTLAPGQDTGPIEPRINMVDWSSYNQLDDYSFDPTIVSYTLYDKVTLYHGGILVSGNPPD